MTRFGLVLVGLALAGCAQFEEREMAVGLIEPPTDPDPAHVEMLQKVALETAYPGAQRPYPEGINLDRDRVNELLAQAEAALDAGDVAAADKALAEARAHVAAIAAVDTRLVQETRVARAKGNP